MSCFAQLRKKAPGGRSPQGRFSGVCWREAYAATSALEAAPGVAAAICARSALLVSRLAIFFLRNRLNREIFPLREDILSPEALPEYQLASVYGR